MNFLVKMGVFLGVTCHSLIASVCGSLTRLQNVYGQTKSRQVPPRQLRPSPPSSSRKRTQVETPPVSPMVECAKLLQCMESALDWLQALPDDSCEYYT